MSKLVIATHNAKKAAEMVQILSKGVPELEWLTLEDFPGAPEPEETGRTYRENAAIKAESAVAFTGLRCVADDAGLEIDGLGGAPGLYSKRFGGEGLPFPDKMARILSMLAEEPKAERSARFRCCVALSRPGRETEIFEATCEGTIAFEAHGANGFGYDPIFFLPELGRTMAELTPEEKHRISHRGKVLRLLMPRLRQ